jgi:nucleotide-binding universal stress UspA family protein
MPVRTVEAAGRVASCLVEESTGSSGVVLGREAKGIVERVLTGATTAAVAAHAEVPVTAVSQGWAPYDEAPDRVVVGLASAAHAAEGLRVAFEEAAVRRCPLEVVHAWQLPAAYQDLRIGREWADAGDRAGEALLEEALQDWRSAYPDVRVITTVVNDDPARALVRASRDATLLVLVRRPDRVLRAHLGHVARTVLHASVAPVVVVPCTAGPGAALDLEVERGGALLR